jgi:hypothetical protein
MRKIILLIALLSIVANPCCAIQQSVTGNLSDGDSVKVYDKHGSYQGKYVQSGNKTKVYNKTGSYQGYSSSSGSKTKYYNKYGNYEGYSKK